ncbi:hypothetical protein KCU86_g23, partial [Aureobasidium melanogenum]
MLSTETLLVVTTDFDEKHVFNGRRAITRMIVHLRSIKRRYTLWSQQGNHNTRTTNSKPIPSTLTISNLLSMILLKNGIKIEPSSRSSCLDFSQISWAPNLFFSRSLSISLNRGESKASMDVSLLPFDLGPRSVVLSRLTFDSLAVTLNGGGSGAV